LQKFLFVALLLRGGGFGSYVADFGGFLVLPGLLDYLAFARF
jgi:hypothetical protein